MSSTSLSQQFDYSVIDNATANFLKQKEIRMSEVLGKAYTDIGKELKEAQDELAKHRYGCFEDWYTSLGFKRDQVYRWIGRYELIVANCDKREMIEEMPLSMTYEMAKSSSHPDAVQAALNGEVKTHKAYKELEAKLKQAEREREEAERRANEAEEITEQLGYEKQLLEQKLQSSFTEDQKEEFRAAVIEEYQAEIAPQLAEKDKQIRQLRHEYNRQIEISSQQSEKYLDQIEKLKSNKTISAEAQKKINDLEKKLKDEQFNTENLRIGYQRATEELESLKLQAPAQFDETQAEEQRKRLQFEADSRTSQLTIELKRFNEKMAIGPFMVGAIATANPSERKSLSEKVEIAKKILNEIETALSGRKVVSNG